MADQRAKHYRLRAEAEREHPRLNENNRVPLTEFADLLGHYDFDPIDWIRCQLADEGGDCHEMHGRGWIAQLNDRSEGYIGHRCANNHFKDDPRFADLFKRAAARVTEEITIGRLAATLQALLEEPKLRATLDDLRRRWEDLFQRAAALRGQLSETLRKELANRRKQGQCRRHDQNYRCYDGSQP